MNNIILGVLCLLSYSTFHAQSWLDSSCENIDDQVMEEELKATKERNIIKVIIDQAGDLEINGTEKPNLTEIKFKEFVLDFVTNPKGEKEKAAKPDKVMFQVNSYQKDSKAIEKFTNYIYDVYLYLWDRESGSEYNSTYVNLNCKKREKIFNDFPLKISSRLDKKEGKKPKRKGIGVPIFGGDTVDN